ncbi:MAG: sigma-70 family RNA polymerase sigma factor [Ilumatobacteraceae bacterium]
MATPFDGAKFGPAQFDEVIAGARNGEDRAIAALFTELQPRLLRFLRAQERAAADDLAAEVWLAVAKSVAQFDGDWTDFRAWFFSIARRRLADHRRTAVRRRTDVVEASVFELRQADDSPEQEALELLSGQQAASLITSLLGGDPAQVLLLRLLADLDVAQVASIMQRSPNWVRVTQHRALRTLARRLGPKVSVMQ